MKTLLLAASLLLVNSAAFAANHQPRIHCKMEQDELQPNNTHFLGEADSGPMRANRPYILRVNGYTLEATMNDSATGDEGGGTVHVYFLDIKMSDGDTSVEATTFNKFDGYNFDYRKGNIRTQVRCFNVE
ncbi:MAG: hypothetical protein ACXWQO_05180 [Bdellovibrionota bacterium]